MKLINDSDMHNVKSPTKEIIGAIIFLTIIILWSKIDLASLFIAAKFFGTHILTPACGIMGLIMIYYFIFIMPKEKQGHS